MVTGFHKSFKSNFYNNFYNNFYHSFYWTTISTRGCYYKVGEVEMEDVPVGFGQVGVLDARVGQMVPPIQSRRGPRSRIPIEGEYIGDMSPGA